MTGLDVRGLHKAFGPQPVLCGIDLGVPEGSLTAILGPSGSGKTTLLRVIAGFERADEGTVTVGGKLVENSHHALPPEQRGIGYVPQEGSLFPHLTVAANIAFGVRRPGRQRRRPTEKGTRRGGRRAGASTDHLLEMVGLAGLGSRYPHQLSGGQQQRVALARALAINPALVLLDEPFSSLDAGLKASVRADVQDVLRAEGITAVLVTHDQDEALSIADQVAVIRDGYIGQCGTPQELYDHPVDPDMAQFLGDANLVTATINGNQVATPFGTLSIRAHGRSAVTNGSVVALVRPEQLTLSTKSSGNGMPGTVTRTQFHGHDTVITIEPTSDLLLAPAVNRDPTVDQHLITVRADGNLVVADGTPVEITAAGSVVTWPATS
jgi:iron(III) transport system ATP-binding protein